MSNDTRHLRDWIAALYATLEEAEPHRAAAIRKLAGPRMSRMVLDAERVTVRFEAEGLRVRRLPDKVALRSPSGSTDRQTVTDLLLGYMEISEAISHDHIRLRGSADDVMAICGIIEILVDASTRIPALQKLAAAFIDISEQQAGRAARHDRRAQTAILTKKEQSFLEREGLLRMERLV